jgi:hypothetical protein
MAGLIFFGLANVQKVKITLFFPFYQGLCLMDADIFGA